MRSSCRNKLYHWLCLKSPKDLPEGATLHAAMPCIGVGTGSLDFCAACLPPELPPHACRGCIRFGCRFAAPFADRDDR
jgi:hypothetical protein